MGSRLHLPAARDGCPARPRSHTHRRPAIGHCAGPHAYALAGPEKSCASRRPWRRRTGRGAIWLRRSSAAPLVSAVPDRGCGRRGRVRRCRSVAQVLRAKLRACAVAFLAAIVLAGLRRERVCPRAGVRRACVRAGHRVGTGGSRRGCDPRRGLVALLIANVAQRRPALAPLDDLAKTMRVQDPLPRGSGGADR